MTKARALIYPFDRTSTYLFNYNDMNLMFDLVGAVAPRGWGIKGKDIGLLYGTRSIGITVETDFENYDKSSYDSVIIVESNIELDFEIILNKVKWLAEHKKNIAVFRNLSSEQLEKVNEICKKHEIQVDCFSKINNISCIKEKNIIDINVPVIFISGLAERTLKYDIQLALRKELLDMGYKVSQIGTKNHCEVFGFHSFPSFIYDNKITEKEKIILFNRYIKAVELNEKPDLIIIGIPGGIMPLNKNHVCDFGIVNYLVSQALKPDISIFSMLYEDYKPIFLNELDNILKYRYGYIADCINISNIKLDYQDMRSSGKIQYILLESEFVDKKIANYKWSTKPLYNILNLNDSKKMALFIVNQLSGENYIKSIL